MSRTLSDRSYDTVAAIAERDAWRCGICLDVIDPSLTYPHPQSVSIDHIVPLSLGGSNRRDNVRASHLLCNVSPRAVTTTSAPSFHQTR